MTDLNKDFEKLAEQINSKIKEATIALKEANRLRVEANLPSLIRSPYIMDDMESDDEADAFEERLEKINVEDLENELCDAGWSTSSSYC